MRLVILVFTLLISHNLKAQIIEKCSNSFDSYSLDICLKNLKYKLRNYQLELKVYSPTKKLFKNKNVFVTICNKYNNDIINIGKEGILNIHFSDKILARCNSLITVNVKTEYGICPEGNLAQKSWNSLKFTENLYLDCKE